jgi:hypothetical protein
VLPIPSRPPPYASVSAGARVNLSPILFLKLPPPRMYGGAWANAMWGSGGVASDNRSGSNHLRLARAPRRGLRGPRPQVPPATIASRAVRRNPASRSPVPRLSRAGLRRSCGRRLRGLCRVLSRRS